MNELIIGKLKKNALEEIWVTIGEYYGRQLLNIRAYFRAGDAPSPTRKGIAVDTVKLMELLDALRRQNASGCDGTQVARLTKGKKDEVRVYTSEYMGRQLVNIRIFYATDNDTEKHHGKGIAFSVNLLPELIRILEVAARHIACARKSGQH